MISDECKANIESLDEWKQLRKEIKKDRSLLIGLILISLGILILFLLLMIGVISIPNILSSLWPFIKYATAEISKNYKVSYSTVFFLLFSAQFPIIASGSLDDIIIATEFLIVYFGIQSFSDLITKFVVLSLVLVVIMCALLLVNFIIMKRVIESKILYADRLRIVNAIPELSVL